MEYKRFGNSLVARLDMGDEILSSLYSICSKESIRLAKVSGIGAVSKATIGVFNTDTHEYYSKTYLGRYEIASLIGNITAKDGKPYFHIHVSIGNTETEECHSGHLNEGVISVTGEIIIDIIDGRIGREFSTSAGLNILKF
jgi:Predicted DNA-binding protein with PD1-like DNA-binding motif